MAAGHRRVEARLVDEDEAVGRYAPDRPPERCSLGDDVGPELLECTARYSARLMLET
jgi:hypothetical protein